MTSLTCPPRWSTPRSPDRLTYGAKASFVAERLGLPLMPWQQHVADVALEVDPATGRLAYRRVVLCVPRQSGKTTLLLALMLTRALAMGERQRIVYTAQTGSDAREKWQDDWLPIILGSSFVRQVKDGRPRLTNGHEALIFTNGSIQSLAAPTKTSGHGKTLDLAIVDEAFSHGDDRVEQSFSAPMITRPQPQIWIVSTAGTPTESPYLLRQVELGRQLAEAGTTSGTAFFEWSAPDDADPYDPATWWATMPALGHTVTEEAVRAESLSMPLPEFRRAYLNQWVSGRVDPIISAAQWSALEQTPAPPITDGLVCFAVDVSPRRDTASIAACYGAPDAPWVEVIECREGTGWVVPRLVELGNRWRPFAFMLDAGSAAGSLLPDLAKAGIVPPAPTDKLARGQLALIGAREYGQACGRFFDAAVQGKVHHLGQAVLTAAVDGAQRRALGDAWAWDRRADSVDITPLVASTLAHWGWCQHRPAPPKVRVVNLADALARAGL